MLSAVVNIEGIRPLLWHAFGPDALPLEKAEKSGVAGNNPDEWKKTVLMTEERQLYLRPTYIFGCLREAAKYTSRKRGTMMSALAGTLLVTDNIILVDRYVPPEPLPTNEQLPVYLDITGVKNPVTRGRNVRYRVAASPGWHLAFNITWDAVIVSRQEMQKCIEDAGALVGLGDGRSIGFGRFVIVSLEFVE